MKTFLIICLLFLVFLIIRTEATAQNRSKVVDNIYNYQTWCVETGNFDKLFDVDFSDMESYTETLYRITDWGHDHILPEDKQHILNTYVDMNMIDWAEREEEN